MLCFLHFIYLNLFMPYLLIEKYYLLLNPLLKCLFNAFFFIFINFHVLFCIIFFIFSLIHNYNWYVVLFTCTLKINVKNLFIMHCSESFILFLFHIFHLFTNLYCCKHVFFHLASRHKWNCLTK